MCYVQIDDDNTGKNVQLNDKHVYLFNFVRTITHNQKKQNHKKYYAKKNAKSVKSHWLQGKKI